MDIPGCNRCQDASTDHLSAEQQRPPLHLLPPTNRLPHQTYGQRITWKPTVSQGRRGEESWFGFRKTNNEMNNKWGGQTVCLFRVSVTGPAEDSHATPRHATQARARRTHARASRAYRGTIEPKSDENAKRARPGRPVSCKRVYNLSIHYSHALA